MKPIITPNCPYWSPNEKREERPKSLKSKDGEDLYTVKWENVKAGDTVYLYSRWGNREYGIGPFTVVNPVTRELCRSGSKRTFIHYPEELYHEV